MGYKLAGYEVLGGVEIDPEMMKVYRANHSPKFSYLTGVQQFNKTPIDAIPRELLDLDILDGSPPCSSFSMAGSREKAWGEKKKFREGQADQVLDDLFFHFIEIARVLQPKVIVAENVKGLVVGKAKGYIKQITRAFDDAGYTVQLFLLNAAFMGVPQKRERTFFVAHRKSFECLPLKLNFNETPISAKQAFTGVNDMGEDLTNLFKGYWTRIKPGNGLGKIGKFNCHKKIHPDSVSFTQTSTCRHMHWESPRRLSDQEVIRLQSFPDDYNFTGSDPGYVCGMSVPPFMMQRVASEIERQWFNGQA